MELKRSIADLAPLRDEAVATAASGAARLKPGLERAGSTLRRNPTLARGFDRAGTVWSRLVEAFCTTIDPFLARHFPDMRLVALVTDADRIVLHRTIKGQVTAVGRLEALAPADRAMIEQARWTAIELRLRPDQVLTRNLSLPSASRDFLAPIIDHRLERLTPWRPEQVLYGYRVVDAATSGPATALSVDLVATSREIVAEPLRRLGALGLIPTAIGADTETMAAPLKINLLRDTALGGGSMVRADSRTVVSRVAFATLAALAILFVSTSLYLGAANQAADAVDVKLVKARRLLRNAAMGNVGAPERTMLEAKQPDRSVTVLIDKLAAAIPADTYLKELAVAPDKVRFIGSTGNAPALVGKLEATGLANVRFTSAITREKNQKDSFEITADRPVAPSGAP